ncbi:unnamed protein product [Brachionus calyciflorus]|uniref:Early endosome antigen 1 n=1 Tax=Brachionus calyciflorus TaxID=104777 RepID=A0A813M3T8_9BILA|nr:unnamed protein product [Brachionus calyciflorus]
MFNKILGKKETPQKESKKPSKKPEDSPSHGFICPVCHLSFENPDILTNHFMNMHQNSDANNSMNDDDIERTSLNATAESILKRLSTSANVTSDTESVHDTKSILSFNNDNSNQRELLLEREIGQLKEKLLTEEEIRSILTNDFNEKLEQTNQSLKNLEKEKNELEKIYKSTITELERVTSENEENKAIRQSLSQIQEEFVNKCQEISKLENELQLRPTGDDLDILKKELIKVQQVTEALLKEKENEQKQLIRENNELKAKIEKQEIDLKNFTDKIEALNELEVFKQKCSMLEENNKLFEQKEKNYQDELKLKQEQLDKQLKDLNDLNLKLNELKFDCESKNSQITNYLIEIKDLNQEKNQLNQNISQLESKKAELMNKILIAESKSHNSDENNDEQNENERIEMLNLVKEKEEIENEVIKLRTKNQSLLEEKNDWLNQKSEMLSKIQITDTEVSDLKSKYLSLENEKSNLEKEKDEIQALLKESRKKIIDNSEQTMSEKLELEKNLKDKEDLITDLNKKLTSLEDQKLSLDDKIVGLNEDLNQLKKQTEEQLDKISLTENLNLNLTSALEEKNQENSSLNKQINGLNQEISNLQSDLLTIKNDLCLTKEANENEIFKNKNLELKNLEYEKKLTEKEENFLKIHQELEQSKIKNEELNSEVSSLNQIIGDLNFSLADNHEKNEARIQELNQNIEKLTISLSELSLELHSAKENEQKYSHELSETKKRLEDLLSNDSITRNTISTLESEKTELLLKLAQNDQIIQNLTEKNEAFNVEKENLNIEITSLNQVIIGLNNSLNETKTSSQSKIEELSQNLERFNSELTLLNFELNKERQEKTNSIQKISELNQIVQELTNAEENLKQKLSVIEIELDDTKLSWQNIRTELDKSTNEITEMSCQIENFKKLNAEIISQKERLVKKLNIISQENEEIKIERDDCDKMRLEAVKKHEIQTKALNQNLANLRNELKQQTDKISQLNSELDQAKGNSLELEAKLSNCYDERNQLLQRCIESEKLCENLKLHNIEFKRKLEDTQAALQELGREHQTLQVLNHKKSNYKWVDDSLVDDCTQCKKAFSVTNRKHHCRNCGQVFCNECSDFRAQVSSSNKPQRVCKACHIELNE